MSSIVKEILASPIQMADQVSKLAEEAQNFRQECLELKSKTEKLAGLLRQAARNSNDLYERPTCLRRRALRRVPGPPSHRRQRAHSLPHLGTGRHSSPRCFLGRTFRRSRFPRLPCSRQRPLRETHHRRRRRATVVEASQGRKNGRTGKRC
ncbi:hypothetical protein HKD37_14G039243 [Glycine soja]